MADRSRTYRTHALVLRRRDQNDADRIIRVFTPELGKLELMGKGVRKTTSRKAGHLELFSHAHLQVAQARTWHIITEAVTVESFRHLRQSLDTISQAGYVCELVDVFTEMHDENQPLWDLVLLVLRELDQDEQNQQISPNSESTSAHLDRGVLLRWFELDILSLAGFQPEFFHCLACGDELEATTNTLSIPAGGIYCPHCGEGRNDGEPISVEVLKILRFLQRRRWPEVRTLTVRPETMRGAEQVLYRYILSVLERNLKSVPFLHQMQTPQG